MRLVTTLLHSAYHYHLWIILAVSSETYKATGNTIYLRIRSLKSCKRRKTTLCCCFCYPCPFLPKSVSFR